MGRLLEAVLLALTFISLLAVAPVNAQAPAETAPTRPEMMQLLADHWIKTQADDGSLPYGFDFLADGTTGQDGNRWAYIVRQAGAFYMLAEYYRYSRDDRLRDAIRRGLAGLKQHSIPIGKSRTQQWLETTRILSLPVGRWKLMHALDRMQLLYLDKGAGKVVSPDGQYNTALAGAGAVALLAEITYSRASGDHSFAEMRKAWLAGLLSLHIPGGGFRDTPTSIDDSDYANGEGWFALAVYSDAYPEDLSTKVALAEVDDAMIRRYSVEPKKPFFHWGAIAAEQRFRSTRDTRFLNFLVSQTEAFLERLRPRVEPNANHCADMEGLTAALSALRDLGNGDTAIAQRIRSRLTREADKLSRLQIQRGQKGLRFNGEAFLTAPRMADFAGAFLLGLDKPIVQVDAGAHCLLAMVRIERDQLLASPPQ
jgi:hypothetical protein